MAFIIQVLCVLGVIATFVAIKPIHLIWVAHLLTGVFIFALVRKPTWRSLKNEPLDFLGSLVTATVCGYFTLVWLYMVKKKTFPDSHYHRRA